MKTLTEKFNGVLEGRYTKSQFLKDVRLSHPNLVTQFTSYDDAVNILKSKALLYENQQDVNIQEDVDYFTTDEVFDMAQRAGDIVIDAKDALEYLCVLYGDKVPASKVLGVLDQYDLYFDDVSTPTDFAPTSLNEEDYTEAMFSPSLIDKAIKVELEDMGLDFMEISNTTEEEYVKAENKVLKNLKKDRNYYDQLIFARTDKPTKKTVTKGNTMEPVTKSNSVDKVNGMSKVKVNLKEYNSPEYYDRMDGLVNIKALEAVKKGSAIVLRELTDEGFEEEEVLDFLINQIKDNYGISVNTTQDNLFEDHSKNPNDKYVVKKCNTEGNWKVWEGDHLVKKFKDKKEAQTFADKKNKEQGLEENKKEYALKEAVKGIIKGILNENDINLQENYSNSTNLDLAFIKTLYINIVAELENTGEPFESVFPRPGDFMSFAHTVYVEEGLQPTIQSPSLDSIAESKSRKTVGDYIREYKNKK